jgi:hypothetical protein
MTTDEPTSVPAEVLILIKNPPLLKGESKEDYYCLLAALARDVRPADLAEWLWLIELLNCVWEIFRNGRFRAKLIDMNRHQALGTVILKHMPERTMGPRDLAEAVAGWNASPGRYKNYEIDPETVPAMAFSQAARSLEKIDKISERLQRRWDSILQQLEDRREMFAHRARRAADLVRNQLDMRATESVDPATPDANPPDETTIVPELPPENGAPTADDAPKEASPTEAAEAGASKS